MIQTFASIEEFYAEWSDRRLSPEYDFGVWWRDRAGGTWRVSWVALTGEVYALRQGLAKNESVIIGGEPVIITSVGSDGMGGPLLVLGNVSASDGECTNTFCSGDFHGLNCPADAAYNVERVLDGWADVCGTPDSLSWVKERVE